MLRDAGSDVSADAANASSVRECTYLQNANQGLLAHTSSDKYEIQPNKLTLGELLGQGAFGKVMKATLHKGQSYHGSRTVAVKTLKGKIIKCHSNYNNN